MIFDVTIKYLTSTPSILSIQGISTNLENSDTSQNKNNKNY